MDFFNAERMIIEGGKSAELDGALQMVCEASIDGELRYPPTACRDLHKVIACQTYSSALYEMVQFLSIAGKLDGGWAAMLWTMPKVTKTACFAVFQDQGDEYLKCEAVEIIITYTDGEFGISYGRMPFLAALAEFVLSIVGFEAMEKSVSGICSLKQVREAANEMSRSVYDYLKDHLPPTQAHRKFARMAEFLGEAHTISFTPEKICDEDILGYWLVNSVEGENGSESELKMFETVYRDFVRLGQAIQLGLDKTQANSAKTIGLDREAGEVEPEALDAWMESLSEDAQLLDLFEDDPVAYVKFFNKREREGLTLLLESGTFAQTWALSFMRCEVFGAGQRRLTQALRRKVADNELAELCQDSASENYEECTDGLDKISEHLKRVNEACLYAVLREDHEVETISHDDNVIAFPSASTGDTAIAKLMDDPDHADRIKVLKKSYGSLNRKGFEERPEQDDLRMAAFQRAAELLPSIQKASQNWLATWGSYSLPEQTQDKQFEADKQVFADQFSCLYTKRT